MSSEKSDAILTRLMDLHPKVIDLSLDRIHNLLDLLGNPETKLPPVVHVAGTNGKGSTIATLRAIAEAAGLRVHVYTSPHLVRFNERIRIAGKIIDDDDLAETLEECERVNDGQPITYFEITTAAAFLAFSRTPADLCLLEVGLGGRLDATNVIAHPEIVGITPVDIDHQQFLGENITQIAAEKAGIIKNKAPTIIAPQHKDAEKVICNVLRMTKSKGYIFERDWHIAADRDGPTMTYSDIHGSLNLPLPALNGEHQIINTGIAIALARHQSAVIIPDAAIKAAISWVRWPARMQQIEETVYNELLPDGSALYLDGGHNPAAAAALRQYLREIDLGERPVILILGMMSTKDSENYIRTLMPVISQVIAVPIEGQEGSASPAELAATASDIEMKCVMASNVASALKQISNPSDDEKLAPIVIISGSLFLAGNVLRELDMIPG